MLTYVRVYALPGLSPTAGGLVHTGDLSGYLSPFQHWGTHFSRLLIHFLKPYGKSILP